MSILGSLAVNLIANTKNFVKGMSGAKKEVKGLGTAAKEMGKLMGLAFGASAVKSFVGGELQKIDALGKTSRQLGISTQSLGAYQHAASLSGLSTDQLETALKKMQDTVGAALLGEAGAIRAFTAMGTSAKEVSKSADPLALIQKHIAGIGDQNKKLAIVRDIFGRGGAEMLNLFETNLAGVREEYERLGLSVTPEEAKRIEELNDSMFLLAEKFKGIGRRLLIDASPDLVAAVKGLNTILESTGLIRPSESGRGGRTSTLREFGRLASPAIRPTGATSATGLVGLAGAALEGRFTEAFFEPVRRVIVQNEQAASL